MFSDREDAGRKLAACLLAFKEEKPCTLALPRGGVPVVFEIAKALDAVLVRKIGAPSEPELALGAIVGGKHPKLELGLKSYVAENSAEELKEIERRRLTISAPGLGRGSRLRMRGAARRGTVMSSIGDRR
jgi:putative phosphoribosyl transferase